MSEEEKEAINNLRFYSTNIGFSKYDGTACLLRARDVQILLNLVGKQHQELEQEKEKNKELEEQNQFQRKQLNDAFDRGWIHKDKLKAIVDEHIPKQHNIITGEIEYTPNANANSFLVQDILELLEDR